MKACDLESRLDTAREMKFMSNVVKVMIQQATDRQSVLFDGDDARECHPLRECAERYFRGVKGYGAGKHHHGSKTGIKSRSA